MSGVAERLVLSATLADQAIQRLLKAGTGTSAVEPLYASHSKWPLPRSTAIDSEQRPIRISVLDSSFNPPTLAHLALALANPPPSSSSLKKTALEEDYDARLLLLSVRNVDKALKLGDATWVQRIQMMSLLSQDIEDPNESKNVAAARQNVAIAAIDEPTFVGKSSKLLSFLQARLAETHSHSDGLTSAATTAATTSNATAPSLPSSEPTPIPIQLHFILGYDTLTRLFSPRFYDSEASMRTSLHKFFSSNPGCDNSYVVCARRSASASISDPEEFRERAFLESDDVREYVESGHVRIINIGEEEMGMSSTDVRLAVLRGEGSVLDRMLTRKVAAFIRENSLYISSQ